MPYISPNPQEWEEHLSEFSPIIGARSLKTVTPSDTVDLPNGVCRALIATGAGNINVVAADDDPATGAVVIPMAAGEKFQVQARRVYATNTTATGLICVY